MQQERLSYASGPSTQPLLGMTIGEQFDQSTVSNMLKRKRLSVFIKTDD